MFVPVQVGLSLVLVVLASLLSYRLIKLSASECTLPIIPFPRTWPYNLMCDLYRIVVSLVHTRTNHLVFVKNEAYT